MTWPVLKEAALLPMLADHELDELAADIKENGQFKPLVLANLPDPETGDIVKTLVDGRNRLEACRRAGVEPTTMMLDSDEDPVAHVVSANIVRRSLSKGQRAMAEAMLYPDGRAPGRGKKKGATNVENVSQFYITKARAVLRYSPARASVVMSGALSLNAAYEEAKAAKSEEENRRARVARLRGIHPDLADLVEDGTLSLIAAEAESKDRRHKEMERRGAAFTEIGKAVIRDRTLSDEETQELLDGFSRGTGHFEELQATLVNIEKNIAQIRRGMKAT